jgi:putative effector of murein hydrolase
LVHLTLTLAGFQAGMWLCRKARLNPVFNTFLLAVLLIIAILYATGTPYKTNLEGAQFVHFLLGPATVALYRQFDKVRRWALAVFSSIITRALTAAASALAIAWVLGASRETLISLAPKSVTALVAMGITERLGGLPSLTAVLGPPVLNLLGITS